MQIYVKKTVQFDGIQVPERRAEFGNLIYRYTVDIMKNVMKAEGRPY